MVSQNPYQTDPGRVSGLVTRGFLTEYAVRGSISRVLEEDSECGWNQRVSWGLQIAEGLRDIHYANLSHVDLNSHNVVIDEHNNAFLIDLSRTVRTYGWCAPEAWVETDPLDLPLEVTQRADIYSLGMVLWELATGYEVVIPIGMNHEEFFRIEDGSMPKEYKKMVQSCLKRVPVRQNASRVTSALPPQNLSITSQRVFHIPHKRDPFFIGREELLKTIRKKIQDEQLSGYKH